VANESRVGDGKLAIGSLVAKKPEPYAAQGMRDSIKRKCAMNVTLAFVASRPSSMMAFDAICIAILVAFVGAAGYAAPSRADSTRVMLRWIFGIALRWGTFC